MARGDIVDIGVICVDDTRRNVRRIRQSGREPVLGHRCHFCRAAVIADPKSIELLLRAELDGQTTALYCVRCAAEGADADLTMDIVPGTENDASPEAIQWLTGTPAAEVCDALARGTMGAQG